MNRFFFLLSLAAAWNSFSPPLLAQENEALEEVMEGPSSAIQESEPSSPGTELSDGPQSLPATPSTPRTETVPKNPPKETSAEVEAPLDSSSEAESPLQKKTGVIPEEDLLKTTKKKVEKVKSQKKTETEMYVQEAEKYKLNDTYKNLQLNDVIEQGLRKNYAQNLKSKAQELNEIAFSGAKNAFWLPELKITLTTDPQKIGSIKNSSRPPAVPHSSSPSGALGLSLGNYTLFNWGKDYALYLNQSTAYERSKEILSESKRELKLDLIASFFALIATKNIEKIRQDELRQTSFIYRLTKEKIAVGKTSKQDFYQARSEYLKSQNEYHQAKMLSDQADEQTAFLIADPVGTKYVLNETLEYKRIRMGLDDLLALAEKNNPTLLTDKVLIANAERTYDVAVKENMPLPKFSIDLGAYSKRFGPTTNSTTYQTYSGSGNVEIVATLNASWSLTGRDGLFNSNKLATGRIGKELAQKEFEKDGHYTHSLVRQTYKNVLSLQNQMVILEARLPSLQKTLDTIVENYLAARTKFYDFSWALQDLTLTKIYYEEVKLQHLKEKLTLAKLAGIEDFQGENFELLATRIKGK